MSDKHQRLMERGQLGGPGELYMIIFAVGVVLTTICYGQRDSVTVDGAFASAWWAFPAIIAVLVLVLLWALNNYGPGGGHSA